MISDARGGHVSPGIYTEEKDVTYSVKSLGITSLGLVGETVKGPAFQALPVQDWGEYVDYFGGTSPEKFKGTGLPKYELPYIAKSYLQESKNLTVVRVLGLSGYETSKAFTVTATPNGDTGKTQVVVVLRSKADYKGKSDASGCTTATQEAFNPFVTEVTVEEYNGKDFTGQCTIEAGSGYTISLEQTVKESDGKNILVSDGREGMRFALTVNSKKSGVKTYNVSLNPLDRDYIYNVFTSDPKTGDADVFIESVYDYALNEMIQNLDVDSTVTFSGGTDTDEYLIGYKKDANGNDKPNKPLYEGNTNFKEMYRPAQTPWIVSNVLNASTEVVDMKRLFKVWTISDGNAANYQVKISIMRVRPDSGLFDLWVRDFYDTDESPVVLEKYTNLSMVEGSSNFIGLKIGTYDGTYEMKSKYIAIELAENEGVEECVPCGFLGYPVPKYGAEKRVEISYNRNFDVNVKPKRQYFGLNSNVLDEDILNYKGVHAYSNGNGDFDATKVNNGFHLDAVLDSSVIEELGGEVRVDGVSGFSFTTVNPVQASSTSDKNNAIPRIITEAYAERCIYDDLNLRKFTVYPYGGFDGWDVYRTSRTNTDAHKATKYALTDKCPFSHIGSEIDLDPSLNLNLPKNAINTDYYAYLAGYRQFANPSDVDINVFATPGIDYSNNTLLVEDALDMIEDMEDGRGGDAIYVVSAPFSDMDGYEYTAEDVVSELEDSEISSSYACTYWPWVKYYDGDAKMYINLPVTKDVVRNMAATDNQSYPWFAPAGFERGNIDCVRATVKTTLSDEDELYNGRVNPIKTFAVDGPKVWGNKTMYTVDSPLNRVNVRRLMLRVKKLVIDASKVMIFDQYDNALDKQFKSLVEPILANVKSNRGISDYRVVTENTPETRDQHILPCKILVKPTPTLEYISISFVIFPESVQFTED